MEDHILVSTYLVFTIHFSIYHLYFLLNQIQNDNMFCMLLLVLLLLIDNRQKIKWVPVFLLENPLLHSVTVRNVSSIKSHLIKVILPWKRSVRNNYISNIAYTHHCWTQKNITPLNASNDPENLLQVHALPKKEKEKKKESKRGGEKKSGFGQVVLASSEAPWGVYFILTVNQCYRTYQIMHLSLNFTFAFKSGEGNEHCWLKIRAQGRQ